MDLFIIGKWCVEKKCLVLSEEKDEISFSYIMASTINEESVEKKLKTVNNTQDSIQSLSLWIIHHKSHHSKIVELWMKVLKKTVQPAHRLTLFYLCNDVVQTCKKKKAFVYNTTFKEHLREAASLVAESIMIILLYFNTTQRYIMNTIIQISYQQLYNYCPLLDPN
ncbi:Regulation of nuclear pre-mRNA domain-containing protein 2 [Bulinus truncatus]|nr:Regulation of nuclear pre-mRNA domain-containing protein 2 [Bulinus truncatus]